jgi:hypothetical protein
MGEARYRFIKELGSGKNVLFQRSRPQLAPWRVRSFCAAARSLALRPACCAPALRALCHPAR